MAISLRHGWWQGSRVMRELDQAMKVLEHLDGRATFNLFD
jgi:hypothetical protein